MIVGFEGGICSGKTTIAIEIARRLGYEYIKEHTDYIPSTYNFNYNYVSYDDFEKSFVPFLDAEKIRTTNLKESVVLDRTYHSLLGFVYAKGKIDVKDYYSLIYNKYFKKGNVLEPDIIFYIQIPNDIRINRLKNDTIRFNNTPALFYSEEYNMYNNQYLEKVLGSNNVCIHLDGQKPLEELINAIETHIKEFRILRTN